MELTSLVIPLLLAAVAAWGAARRVDVYAALTDGAMDGLRVDRVLVKRGGPEPGETEEN